MVVELYLQCYTMDKVPFLIQIELHTKNIIGASFADSVRMYWVPVEDAVGADPGPFFQAHVSDLSC